MLSRWWTDCYWKECFICLFWEDLAKCPALRDCKLSRLPGFNLVSTGIPYTPVKHSIKEMAVYQIDVVYQILFYRLIHRSLDRNLQSTHPSPLFNLTSTQLLSFTQTHKLHSVYVLRFTRWHLKLKWSSWFYFHQGQVSIWAPSCSWPCLPSAFPIWQVSGGRGRSEAWHGQICTLYGPQADDFTILAGKKHSE